MDTIKLSYILRQAIHIRKMLGPEDLHKTANNVLSSFNELIILFHLCDISDITKTTRSLYTVSWGNW